MLNRLPLLVTAFATLFGATVSGPPAMR